MFVRLRWFTLGFLAAAVLGAMIVKRARAMKERLDAEGVARIAASYVADAVEAVGRAMQRTAATADVASADSKVTDQTVS